MRPGLFPKRYADLVQRFRVAAGLLLAVAFVWLARPTTGSIAAGAAISAIGLILRGWAAGHLAKNERLATTGPYAWTRNPLYAGSLIVAGGIAVAAGSPVLALLFAAVFTLVYLPAIQLEEEHLRKLFPAYGGYAESVGWLWPTRRAVRGKTRFSWSLYVRNQEYQALIAWLLALAALWWKSAPA
jgi:protein-S-isoprenylcysteine O-methyltransferase Ste14